MKNKSRLVHGHIQNILDNTGMTQTELAKRLDMRQSQINGFYTLRQKPGPKLAEKIALFAGCTIEEVMTNTVMYKEVDELLTSNVYDLTDTKEVEYSGPPFEEMIAQLPVSYQHILVELFVNGKRASDIARDLGVTPTTVMFKKNKSLRRLRRMYKDTNFFEEA